MLTLKQLETFIQVVELGTFERASQRLNATQSTVSKRISELEQASGLTLFDRSKRNSRLTEEGESLLELAYSTLNSANRILELSRKPERFLHRLRIGFTDLSAFTWLPAFLREHTLNKPNVRLDINIGMSRTLYQQFQDGELDLIVIPSIPEAYAQPDVEIYSLNNVEMSFMVKEGLITGPRPLPVLELQQHTLITQGKNSGFAQSCNRWLNKQGVTITSQTADNLLAIVALVTAGRGISVLPKLCVQNFAHDQGLDILDIDPPLPEVNYCAMYHNGTRIQILEELAHNLGEAVDFTQPFFNKRA